MCIQGKNFLVILAIFFVLMYNVIGRKLAKIRIGFC